MFIKFFLLFLLLLPVVSFSQEDDLLAKILSKDRDDVDEQVTCQIKLPSGINYDYRNTEKSIEFNSESLFSNNFGDTLFSGTSRRGFFNTSSYRLTPNYLGLNEQERKISLSYTLLDDDEALSFNFESLQFTPRSLFEDYQPGPFEGYRERNIFSLDYTKTLNDGPFYLLGGLQLEHYTNDSIIGNEFVLEDQLVNLNPSRYENLQYFDSNRENETDLKIYGGVGFRKAMELGDWKCTVGAEVLGGLSTQRSDKSEVQFRGGITFDSQDWGGRDRDNPYLIMSLMTDIRSDFDDNHNEMAMFTIGTSVKISDWLIKPFAGVAVYNESGDHFFGFDEEPYFVLGFTFTRSKRRR